MKIKKLIQENLWWVPYVVVSLFTFKIIFSIKNAIGLSYFEKADLIVGVSIIFFIVCSEFVIMSYLRRIEKKIERLKQCQE